MTIYLGLVGHGIGYSLSPQLQGAALAATGIAGQYLLLDTSPNDFQHQVDKLRNPEWLGANITVPYKQRVLSHLDWVDEHALRLDAVNTIVQRQGRLLGYNTDAIGLARDLGRLGIELTGQSVVVLGAGGAAAAVLSLLGSSSVTLYCRRRERGRELVQNLGIKAQVRSWTDPPANCHILFNCTPPASNWSRLAMGAQKIYDLNYQQPPSQGYFNGLGMLVYQGAESFGLWTGECPLAAMAEAVGLSEK